MKRKPRRRTGFTLMELVIAGVVAAFVIGAVSTSLSRLSQAKNICKHRVDAFLRADAALTKLRRNVATALRSDDLFYMRVILTDDQMMTRAGLFERDELLMFHTSIDTTKPVTYNGEGSQFEVQYRAEDDENGPMLWQRRDAMPDEYERAGGTATPLVEGVVGLAIEAYDGATWEETWDSDVQGMPEAIKITVWASGYRMGADAYAEDVPITVLRTIVPIDRLLPLHDEEAVEALEEERRAAQAAANGIEPGEEDGGSSSSSGGPGIRRSDGADGRQADFVRPPGGDRGRGRGGRGGGGGGGGRGGGGGGGRPPASVPSTLAPGSAPR